MSDSQSTKGWLIPTPPPDTPGGALLVALCSGEELLSRTPLERFPACRLLALDGSAEMRERTRDRSHNTFAKVYRIGSGHRTLASKTQPAA